MNHFFTSFQRMKCEGKIPPLFLFSGPKESDKEREALCAAQSLLETKSESHVDLHHYYPEGKTGMHSLYSIKNLCQEISLSAHAGGYKCFLIHHAERMLPSSSNALLKTFEEPPPHNVIFLLTAKPALILPTIRSRAQSYSFHYKKVEGIDELQKKWLGILSGALSLDQLEELCEGLDRERKQEEKELPTDQEMTMVQRERVVKEREGRGTLLYQEKREALFLTYLYFYRDLTFTHLGERKELYYPDLVESYEKLEPRNLDEVEVLLRKVRLAHDRGVKLHHCLEILLT